MKYRKNNKDIECWCTNNLYVASLSNLNVSKEITIAHHTQGIKWNMETKYNGLWLYDFKNVKKEYNFLYHTVPLILCQNLNCWANKINWQVMITQSFFFPKLGLNVFHYRKNSYCLFIISPLHKKMKEY